MRKTTKDYVREYFKEFPPENLKEENDLLELAKEIKTKLGLTVKVCTIMITIAQIMREDYNDNSLERIEKHMLKKVSKKVYLYGIANFAMDGKIYFKIETSELKGERIKSNSLLCNPGIVKIAETYHEKNIITKMDEICSKTATILSYIVKGSSKADMPRGYKIDNNIYTTLKDNSKLAFEIIEKVKDLIMDWMDTIYEEGKTLEDVKNIAKRAQDFKEIQELKELYLKLGGENESFPLTEALSQKLFISLLYRGKYIRKVEFEEMIKEFNFVS